MGWRSLVHERDRQSDRCGVPERYRRGGWKQHRPEYAARGSVALWHGGAEPELRGEPPGRDELGRGWSAWCDSWERRRKRQPCRPPERGRIQGRGADHQLAAYPYAR